MLTTDAFRLMQGEDLYLSLLKRAEHWPAAFVLTCVGSLSQAAIRFADAEKEKILTGPFEILTLAGTASASGLHLHISVADIRGQVLGGHLKPGSVINTTAEVVMGIMPNTQFRRTPDKTTGYLELEVLQSAEKK